MRSFFGEWLLKVTKLMGVPLRFLLAVLFLLAGAALFYAGNFEPPRKTPNEPVEGTKEGLGAGDENEEAEGSGFYWDLYVPKPFQDSNAGQDSNIDSNTDSSQAMETGKTSTGTRIEGPPSGADSNGDSNAVPTNNDGGSRDSNGFDANLDANLDLNISLPI